MKIVVCIKRVPDTAARIEVAASGTAIDTASVSFVTSPYDEFALEEALRLKEAHGGEVVAVCLGPAEAAKELRDALARGADAALHLQANPTSTDPHAVARALADALRPLAADLILFGYKAADDDDPQLPAQVATLLGLPCVTEATELLLDGKQLKVVREIAGGQQRASLPLPACISTHKTAHEPRIPNLKGIMAAKKKPLETRTITLATPELVLRKLAPPPARQAGRKIDGDGAVAAIVAYLKNELKLI
jgi:electron transfer flavoprotein beta subunit